MLLVFLNLFQDLAIEGLSFSCEIPVCAGMTTARNNLSLVVYPRISLLLAFSSLVLSFVNDLTDLLDIALRKAADFNFISG